MIAKFIKYSQYIPNLDYYKEMRNMFPVLVIVSLFISTQGGMFTVTFRAMMFIYFGAILGVFSRFYERGYKDQKLQFSKD
ncbi:MAG: hypothetical protein HC896_14135 [Bacteroidales bacterium]|nr:hypothetical protein [Bacteroidales bacterium]